MLRKISPTLSVVAFLLLGFAYDVAAQVAVPLPDNRRPTSIIVSFPSNIQQIEGTAIPANPPPAPSIYFKEAGKTIYLTATAILVADNQISLSNFKSLGDVSADLIDGSADGAVPPLTSGKRAYVITWSGVKLETQSQASPVIVIAEVGTAAGNPVTLSTNLRLNKREFTVAPIGVSARTLLDKFAADPSQIEIRYTFSLNDPVVAAAPGNMITKRAVGLRGNPNDTNPLSVIVDLGEEAPSRPENYSASIRFPAAPLRGSLKPGFTIPPPKPGEDDVVSATRLIEVAAVNLSPPPTERPKTEFFFDATFTSIVNATTRKRSNVGLFGLHFKPIVGLRFFNLEARTQEQSKRPQWIALRPIFDADVDTQPIKNSQAPNRIVFGADFEWGIDAGRQKPDKMDLIQQYIFLNGVRYDSDRDFKVQTLYWQTEFQPQFLNFEQTRDQRLRQFRRPCDPGLLASAIAGGERTSLTPEDCQKLIDAKARLFPVVSSYYVRPSVGYQLGGTIKKGDADSDTISRLFVKFGAGIEIRRLIQFSLDDTYYFLQDASRRRNRNYLETRLDFNTGSFFNIDLASLQSAITFKFQRGELPPRFKPVNVFSIGFKLYR